jgi:hypothetical protein
LFLALYWRWHGERLGSEQLLGNAAIAAEWAERGRYPTPLYVEGMSIMEDGEDVRDQVDHVTGRPDSGSSLDDAESLAFYALWIRDIFGNPFRPATLEGRCRTPTILSLSQAAYHERQLPSGHLDNARLAVLSDALEEAGCDDEAILAHLRSPGSHVRGCWALDLILGRH